MRPSKIERIAAARKLDPVNMLADLLTKHQSTEKVAQVLRVSERTVTRYLDAHLDHTCVWTPKTQTVSITATPTTRSDT